MTKRLAVALFACLWVAVPGRAAAQADQTGELFKTSHGLYEIVRINAKGCGATVAEAKAYRGQKLDAFNKSKAMTRAWLAKLDKKGQQAYLERNKQQIVGNSREAMAALTKFTKACKKEAPAVQAIVQDFNFQ